MWRKGVIHTDDVIAARRDSNYQDHSAVIDMTNKQRPSGIPKSLGGVLSNKELRYKFRLFLKERLSAESCLL